MTSGLLLAHVLCLLAAMVCLDPLLTSSVRRALGGILSRSPRQTSSAPPVAASDEQLRELLLQRAREKTLLRDPRLVAE